MNIIIDVTRLARRRLKKQVLTGIDRVSLAYVNHYKEKARALFRYCGINFILSVKNSQNLFNWLESADKQAHKLPLKIMLLSSVFNKKQPNEYALLNTGHIGINQKNYIKMLNKYRLKSIFFVHDLIPIYYPEYCSPGEDIRLKNKLDYILKYGHGIISNSTDTLDKFNQYCHDNKLRILPATTALLAPSNRLLTCPNTSKPPITKPYFVMLSTIEPRKNHLLILQIFRKLAEKSPDRTPHLFIIGKRGWECEQVFDLLDRCVILKNVVTELSNCSDEMVINYLKHSSALLFPSFTEGYGLPLIEALAIGTPVIASDLEVFKEIAGNIPEYIDALDAKSWQNTILEYSNKDSQLRQEQIQRLQNFSIPDWEEHFRKIDNFLINNIFKPCLSQKI